MNYCYPLIDYLKNVLFLIFTKQKNDLYIYIYLNLYFYYSILTKNNRKKLKFVLCFQLKLIQFLR